ncbi:MAG: hypothetical protein MSQ05_01305 [Akkermansia sp.]|nr:hypothetical protein [Akkermansia sp.]
MISGGGGWYTCGPCGVLACPACYGAGIPEAVAGHACAGGGGTPAGREISRRWCAPAAPAVCLPALPVMVTACRWCGRACLRGGGALAGRMISRGGWCTCGRMISGGVVHLRPLRCACLPRLSWCGHVGGVAGYACAGVVHLRAHDLRRRGTPAAPAVACLPCLPWCGHAGGGGRVCLRGGGALAGRMISGGVVVCTGGPCGVLACPAWHGAGVPEAGAWCACAAVCTGGA